MQHQTAVELVKAIYCYPEAETLKPCVVEIDGGWQVRTTQATYDEVPDRLELAERPCPCDARFCASGKVARNLLDMVRVGEKIEV